MGCKGLLSPKPSSRDIPQGVAGRKGVGILATTNDLKAIYSARCGHHKHEHHISNACVCYPIMNTKFRPLSPVLPQCQQPSLVLPSSLCYQQLRALQWELTSRSGGCDRLRRHANHEMGQQEMRKNDGWENGHKRERHRSLVRLAGVVRVICSITKIDLLRSSLSLLLENQQNNNHDNTQMHKITEKTLNQNTVYVRHVNRHWYL